LIGKEEPGKKDSDIAQTCSIDLLTARNRSSSPGGSSSLFLPSNVHKNKKARSKNPYRGKLLLALADDSLPST
ncbi:MAG TPA: hypothetical protein VFU31_04995, partial [Candidatus Binatia bacterium]|nr:hypothetical protein [Candidatus Binatia bacterium]